MNRIVDPTSLGKSLEGRVHLRVERRKKGGVLCEAPERAFKKVDEQKAL